MTVKKAIKILDWWINQKEEKIKEIPNFNFKDTEIETILRDNGKTIIKNLELIKKELVPNCKHPKKMRDKCGSVEYCMSCNLDM